MNETPSSNPRPANRQADSNTQALSTNLQENIASLKTFLPIGKSFDLMYRDLFLGDTPAYWLGINGFSG